MTWEQMGFQQEDKPETDIRGAGVLGILILISIGEKNPDVLASALKSANQGPSPHDYPFALTSFQITCI